MSGKSPNALIDVSTYDGGSEEYSPQTQKGAIAQDRDPNHAICHGDGGRFKWQSANGHPSMS